MKIYILLLSIALFTAACLLDDTSVHNENISTESAVQDSFDSEETYESSSDLLSVSSENQDISSSTKSAEKGESLR